MKCKAWKDMENRKHVFTHGDTNAYGEAKRKWSLRENELYSHLRWKGQSMCMGKHTYDIFNFSKSDFNSKTGFWDGITCKCFRVIVWCEWMQKVRWVKMGLHVRVDGEWDGRHVIAFDGWRVKCCNMEDGNGIWWCSRMKWNENKFLGIQSGKNQNASTQNTKTSKEKHTSGKWVKHFNKQSTSTCKFEFGVWGKTKNMKMNNFFIFKGKMHFLWYQFQQVAIIKQ